VLGMLLVGHLIALLTCASVSAICTNGRVGPGGPYYIISRALGPEFGGSIGFLFYIAQATGVAFYLAALAETLLENFEHFSPFKMIPFLPDDYGGLDPSGKAARGDVVFVSSCALLVVFVISMLGSSIFAKASLAIFSVIVSALFGSLVSFIFYTPATVYEGMRNNFTGLSAHTLWENMHPEFVCEDPCTEDALDKGGLQGTFYVFSCVLPSMTGILAGANMSGDLKNPGRAIPQGTFAAIFFMFVSYLLVIIFNAAAIKRGELRHNYYVRSPATSFQIGMLN
jgi:potassium/chloride transporter 9